MKYLIIVSYFFFSFLIGCKGIYKNVNSYNARADIRFGSKFYSILLNEIGEGYVIKGNSSYYTESFNIESSDTSSFFKIDSAKSFFKELNKIKDAPVISDKRIGSPRVEIYYDDKKIYDACKWDESFWDIFRPIMEQLPKNYNPFLIDEKPFE